MNYLVRFCKNRLKANRHHFPSPRRSVAILILSKTPNELVFLIHQEKSSKRTCHVHHVLVGYTFSCTLDGIISSEIITSLYLYA